MVASVETRPVTRGSPVADWRCRQAYPRTGTICRRPRRVRIRLGTGHGWTKGQLHRDRAFGKVGMEKGRGQVRGARGAVGGHRHRRRAGEPWIHLDTADVPLGRTFSTKPACGMTPAKL